MIAELVTALSIFCPAAPRAELRQDAQALVTIGARYHLEPSLLAAVMVVESTCRRDVKHPRTGAGGLMGILHRIPNETYIDNINASAKLVSEYRVRCGDRGFALSSYNMGPRGGKNCRTTRYSERVLEYERQIARYLPVSS